MRTQSINNRTSFGDYSSSIKRLPNTRGIEEYAQKIIFERFFHRNHEQLKKVTDRREADVCAFFSKDGIIRRIRITSIIRPMKNEGKGLKISLRNIAKSLRVRKNVQEIEIGNIRDLDDETFMNAVVASRNCSGKIKVVRQQPKQIAGPAISYKR